VPSLHQKSAQDRYVLVYNSSQPALSHTAQLLLNNVRNARQLLKQNKEQRITSRPGLFVLAHALPGSTPGARKEKKQPALTAAETWACCREANP